MREIWGQIYCEGNIPYEGLWDFDTNVKSTGAFNVWRGNVLYTAHGRNRGSNATGFDFYASRVVPVANENRPYNHAIRIWRRDS